jgi:hypothetical protein
MQRKGVAGGTLLPIGSHHMDVAERRDGLLENAEPLGENAVVVAEKEAHG